MTKSLGDIPVDPIVTFGGDTLYFQTLNVAHVGLKHADAPSAEQRQIAMTDIESLEWEEVAWSREVWIEDYQTATGMAKLTTGYDGYLVYPHYRHHPEILQPLEHTTVRVKVELAEPVPEGMVGTLHLAWYDPDNTLANEPDVPPPHNGHGRRDNAQDVELIEAGAPLPGFTLEFSTAGLSSTSDSIQKSYLAVNEARYADNFIVAAHPNQNVVTQYEFRDNDAQDVVLMYQENTGLWAELPDDAQHGDFRTSVLTILPSVDIDCDSDNTATPTWHGIDRSDWEEYIENEADYPGKMVFFNHNDDNGNGIPDYLENADYEYPPGMSWVPFPDPDLVPVVLDRGFADLTGMDGFLFELKVTADTDYGLRYWLDPEKSKIVNGINEGNPVKTFEAGKWKDVYTWEVSGETVNYPPLIYVEGINPEALTDTLMWRLFDPDEHQVDVDTVKMTDPFVDLDIDSDNNGYINTYQNPARELAEDTLELYTGKPVTYVPGSPFEENTYSAKQFDKSRFVPLRLRLKASSPAGENDAYSFVYDPSVLALYKWNQFVPPGQKTTIPAGVHFGLLSDAYRIKAVGPPVLSDSLSLIVVNVEDGNQDLLMQDAIYVRVQDNEAHLSDWVIPNGWRITTASALSTPTPVDGPGDSKAMGPQDEGSGVTFNMGDAFTRDTYEHGFELTLEYALTRHWVRADDRDPREVYTEKDSKKHSFVANSGVKIGPIEPLRRPEINIIDLDHWLDNAVDGNINDLPINDDGMITFEGGYQEERVNWMLPGILYDGDYFGLTDAKGMDTLAEEQYKALIRSTRDCWDTSSMIITADPRATDGVIKVYMQRIAVDPEKMPPGVIHDMENDAKHPEAQDYYLFYRTDSDRDKKALVVDPQKPPAERTFHKDTRIHLQSHWGSEVKFTNIHITKLEPPQE